MVCVHWGGLGTDMLIISLGIARVGLIKEHEQFLSPP